MAFKEAMQPEFKIYQQRVVENAKAMAQVFLERGLKIVSGGTDNHLFLVDLIEKDLAGKEVDPALGRANIAVNKNAVPKDPQSPFVTRGIRIGSPTITTRRFREIESQNVANWIYDVIGNINDQGTVERVKREVLCLCGQFPVYGG